MTTYREIRDAIQSFDILLFSGRGLVSRGIQALTNSPWSHVAVALRLREFDQVLCYESTTLSDQADLVSGRRVKGVQLVQLSARLAGYEGEVAWRAVHGRRSAAMNVAAGHFMRAFQGRPYEENQWELLKAALDATPVGRNEPDESSVFCSEMVALLEWHVGIMLDAGQPANEFTPADFAGDGLPFAPGFSAGDIVPIGAFDG
jgi:hypothetical protein